MSKIRTAEDTARYRAALIPVDAAFWASEQKWGVGRLERLLSQSTLLAYQRGWDSYRQALDDGDGEAIEIIGPKMIAALAFMDAEATAAGHKPLAPETWEAAMPDGTVLVVVRSNAEASAVLRASHAPHGVSYETTLPPDIAVTVRHQREGRALTVITMAEVARLVAAHGSVAGNGKWEGTPSYSGVQADEGAAAEMVRNGFPLSTTLAQPEVATKSQPLDF